MKTLIITEEKFVASYLSVVYSHIEPHVISEVKSEISLADYDVVIAPAGKLCHKDVSNLLTYEIPIGIHVTESYLATSRLHLKDSTGKPVPYNIQLHQESPGEKNKGPRELSRIYSNTDLTNDENPERRLLAVS
jgi:hypothetical protein